jgi:4-amino-4-deoxy-L-arabinose transferase-like glycosyltransferase
MDLSTKGETSSELVRERDDDSQPCFPSLSAWLKDHVYLASLIVLIAALVPRLFLTLAADDPHDLLASDSGTYLTPAENLLEHGAFLNSEQMPEVSRTPGYPTFILAIMLMTRTSLDGEGLGTVLVMQTVILSLSVLFLYWLARRILPPLMALTGAFLAAFSPWGAVIAGVPLTEGLFVFLLALLLLLIKLVEDTTSVKHAVWGSIAVGLVTGCAVLVRPVWPFLPLAAGALYFRYGPRRKGVGLVLAFMIVSAAMPVGLWTIRNVQEANFYGLSDIPRKTAWLYLGSRVIAQANGSDADRWAIEQEIRTMDEETTKHLSVQQADDERWRRAKAVFREHPFLTVSSFFRSVAEHMVHPSPGTVLTPAKLNFPGDYWVLAGLWGVMVILACLGWRKASDCTQCADKVDRGWLLTILAICLFLTLLSGVSYGGGARFRAPLELIVPLLAGVALVRLSSVPWHRFSRFSSKNRTPIPPKASVALAVLISVYRFTPVWY